MSKINSKISIGIPVFNAEDFLEDAIKSVLAQTFTDWELIIIDDGSTDNSLQIAKKYESERVRVYSDGLNKKLPARLNEIVRLARYDFIARMDADDLILPTKIEKQLAIIVNKPDVDIVSTGVVNINSENKVLGTRSTSSFYVPTLIDVIAGRSGIVHASILARKNWYLRNPYNEKNLQAEDYQLWAEAKIRNDLNVWFLDEPLYCYRVDQNVQLKKMLRGYSQQRKFIKNIISNRSIDKILVFKELFKLYLKSIYVYLLFSLKLDFILLRNRSQAYSKVDFYQSCVDDLIK